MGGTIRVLYVADDTDVTSQVATGLESEDEQFLVETATSASAGLSRFPDADIDCVVAEYDLGDGNGVELFELIRDRDRDVPCILCLDDPDDGLASEVISRGVTDYFQRASDGATYSRLATRVRSALGGQRSDRPGRRPEEVSDGAERTNHERECQGGEQYRELLESSPNPVFIYTEEGELIYANDAAAGFLKTDEPDDLLGTAPGECTHPESNGGLRRRWDRLVEGRGPVPPVEETLVTCNGERKHAIVSSMRVTWEGEPAVQTVLTDVTGRRERERQHRRERDRFVTLFENLPNPVVYGEMVDDEPIIKRVNPAFEETFGYDADVVVGSNVDELTVPEEKQEEARQLNEQIMAEGGARFEGERLTSDGRRQFVINLVLDSDGERDAHDGYAIYTDITEQKERTEELRRKNERLDKFAGFVSHDLRNPLNTLQLSLEMAEQTGESEHFERCRQSADRMEQLLDDLLSLARQGRDVESQERVHLAAAVRKACRTVATDGAELSVETDLTTQANRGRLRELLENLVRNAVEHAGDEARVTVGEVEGENGFYVADDGPGIPPDERDTVFEAGYSTETHGTGFGLAIVRDVVEGHGWTVSLDESSQGGARIEITGVEHP